MADIKVGDSVVDIWGNPGIVVKIIPGVDIEDHGCVQVWQSERFEYGSDNCEHYCHFGWKTVLKVIK